MTWPQRTDEIETRQWTIEDLREGDLVFGQKAGGALVTLCRLAEEPWLHVGSVVADGDELKVVEIRGDRFLLTELSSFFGPGRYVEWGAARLRVQEPCWHGANEWMCSHLSGDNGENTGTQVYAWDDLILAGVMSATRRGLLAKYPDQVRSAIATAGSYCKESLEYRGTTSLTCSAFVQFGYESVGGPCAIEHPRWRSAGTASWPPEVPSIDELFELSPDELAPWSDASVIDLFLQSLSVHRGTSTTRAKPGHVSEGLKVLLAAVAGYALGTFSEFGERVPPGLGVDSRWVTPGDLWRSPSVLERSYITPPTSWLSPRDSVVSLGAGTRP